ncbi:hypothetical protein N9W17_03190 [Jannaschia sp.]|nr:hypothetical protein [Jannaschia sp.]
MNVPFTRTHLRDIALAGIAGQVAFEFYAWVISPIIFGPTLEPANLVAGLWGKAFGAPLSYGSAFVLHTLIGAVGFVALVLLIQAAMKTRYAVAGAVTGLILWFVAQGMLAPLMGRDFMMGFGAYTQSSFVSHVGMAWLMGLILDWRGVPRLGTKAVSAHPAP